ncbi:MAG: hypothetical protein RRY34_03040 [Victivallaceae bacterium]
MAINYQCNFGRNKWNQAEWKVVRTPRWNDMSHFMQEEDCIANFMPDDIRPEDMQMGRDRTGETYASMLYREQISGSAQISATCSFDGRMAPLIVLAPRLFDSYEEHYEAVIYDCGVNLWRYHYENGKLSWELVAFMDMPLEIGRRHELIVRVEQRREGTFIFMDCNGQTVGCAVKDFPADYYAGITACEGKNRFYDFKVESAKQLTAALAERFTS